MEAATPVMNAVLVMTPFVVQEDFMVKLTLTLVLSVNTHKLKNVSSTRSQTTWLQNTPHHYNVQVLLSSHHF